MYVTHLSWNVYRLWPVVFLNCLGITLHLYNACQVLILWRHVNIHLYNACQHVIINFYKGISMCSLLAYPFTLQGVVLNIILLNHNLHIVSTATQHNFSEKNRLGQLLLLRTWLRSWGSNLTGVVVPQIGPRLEAGHLCTSTTIGGKCLYFYSQSSGI